MKLRILPLLFSMILFFSCGTLQKADVGALTDFWTLTESCSADLDLRAYLSDGSVDFLMHCDYRDGNCTVRLLEPEEIGGVTVTTGPDGVSLGLDDTMITAGETVELSPATAFAELLDVWKNAGIDEYGTLKHDGHPCLLLCCAQDGYEFQTLFEAESKLPVSAEVYRDGVRIFSCRFQNVAAVQRDGSSTERNGLNE